MLFIIFEIFFCLTNWCPHIFTKCTIICFIHTFHSRILVSRSINELVFELWRCRKLAVCTIVTWHEPVTKSTDFGHLTQVSHGSYHISSNCVELIFNHCTLLLALKALNNIIYNIIQVVSLIKTWTRCTIYGMEKMKEDSRLEPIIRIILIFNTNPANLI